MLAEGTPLARMDGMKIEVLVKKTIRESTMKRNKRTEIIGHTDLTPLTDLILAQMGPEGDDIRKRLIKFYRQRAIKTNFPLPTVWSNSLEKQK